MTRPKRNPDPRYGRRLSTEQASAVRRDHRDGVAMGELARRLGVSRSSIRAIVDGRTYRGV